MTSLLANAEARAFVGLRHHLPLLEQVTDALQERRTLTGRDMRALVEASGVSVREFEKVFLQEMAADTLGRPRGFPTDLPLGGGSVAEVVHLLEHPAERQRAHDDLNAKLAARAGNETAGCTTGELSQRLLQRALGELGVASSNGRGHEN